jgi:ribosomal protein L11 methyltransferase
MSIDFARLSEKCTAATCLKQKILDLFSQGRERLTLPEVKKLLNASDFAISKRQISAAVKELVLARILIYTNRFSISHLELNHIDEIRIGDRLLLTADIHRCEEPGTAVVRISRGAAFGMGDHPTTRLALEGIQRVIDLAMKALNPRKMKVLDIGTGSGILAIAALNLGVGSAVCIDTDPVARHEARLNAAINGLESRMKITKISIEKMDPDTFNVILANLRPPTLRQLFPCMKEISAPGAYWVLSGFRPEEGIRIEKQLGDHRFRNVWNQTADNWASVAAKAEF